MINQYKANGFTYYVFFNLIIITISIPVKESEVSTLLPFLKKYKDAKDANKFLSVPFTTLIEYMWLLRGSCMLMDSKFCILYLAAAVSDFYIPPNEMVSKWFNWSRSLDYIVYYLYIIIIILNNLIDFQYFLISFLGTVDNLNIVF